MLRVQYLEKSISLISLFRIKNLLASTPDSITEKPIIMLAMAITPKSLGVRTRTKTRVLSNPSERTTSLLPIDHEYARRKRFSKFMFLE